MIKRIQHTANYNNYIKELLEELEDAQAELAVYARLLAMGSDLAQWLQNELENKTVPAHITYTMLSLCTDHGTAAAHTINMEVLSLLNFLDTYWRGTAEVHVGEN